MRKLTKSEKSLLGALAIAAIAAGYNYLFWEPMTAKIEADKTEISGLQPVYDDYQQKIKALPDLKKQLETIKDQPSNEDKFFTADENEEIYLDFLHKAVTDNNLVLDSIAFTKVRVELPVVAAAAAPVKQSGAADGAETQAPTPPPAVSKPRAVDPDAPYLNVTTATMQFSVDYNNPDRLLSFLSSIENNEKMVIVDNAQISVALTADPTQAAAGRGNQVKVYKCAAALKFVSLVFPPTPSPVPGASLSPGAPGDTGSSGATAAPGSSGTTAALRSSDTTAVSASSSAAAPLPSPDIVEVPVQTS